MNSDNVGYYFEDAIGCIAALEHFAKPNWIFRGQRNHAWPLRTSLERVCDNFNIVKSKRYKVENELRREFRRALHDYSSHIPAVTNTLEWLSLMQHHGAPTRLLDFSYSIYVATYFAIESCEEDATVWAINGKWALNESVKLLRKKRQTQMKADILRRRFYEDDEEVVDKVIFGQNTLCACPLNPFRLNERLRVQKGLFMVTGTVNASFDDNLKALPNANDRRNIVRIRIPKSMRINALRQLRDMNISSTSLFPGLDGYARSLSVYHHNLENPDDTGMGDG